MRSLNNKKKKMQNEMLPIQKINKYTILGRLAEGGFGNVYLAETPAKTKVVVKTQKSKAKMGGSSLGISHESTIINYLYGKLKSKRECISPILWYGQHEPTKITCLVMPYYEISLFEYIKTNAELPGTNIQEWIKKTICQIGVSLEYIHQHGTIHRDVRPQNIMLRGSDMFPVLIDFGLSCFYVDEKWRHVGAGEPREELVGSPKYASFYIHCGIRPSRRDDYISLAYVAICGAINLNFMSQIPVSVVGEGTPFPETHIENYNNKMLRECKKKEAIIGFLSQYANADKAEWLIKYVNWAYNLNYETDPAYTANFQ